MNTFFTWLIYLSSFQGLLIALALFRKSSETKRVNILLGIFLLIVSLTLLGRNIFFSDGLDLNGLKLLYLGDQIIFLFGPLLYMVLKQILFDEKPIKISILHFIPALLFVCLIAPYILGFGFEFRDISKNYILNSGLVEGAAILSLFLYQIKNHQLNNEIKTVSDFNEGNYPVRFYFVILMIVNVCLVSWITAFVTRTFFPELYNGFFMYHLIWLCLSLALIILGYHSLSSDRSFNFSKTKRNIESQDLDKLRIITNDLKSLMENQQVYLDPNLSLDSLTKMSGFKKHDVSLALNKIQKMNFFDFVNSYRINHFKTKVNQQEHVQSTILGIAFDSGFNSKTTFNTAFRKFMDMTPKEFINMNGQMSSTL